MSELVRKARRKFLGLCSKFFLGGLLLGAKKAQAIIPFGFFKTKIPARIAYPITISANTQNYVLNTAKVSGYVSGKMDVTLTINSGVYVGSTGVGSYSLTVDSSWAAGDTVTIINNGYIIGCGGNANGGVGGPALSVARATSINNVGTIGGGGGAGGAGGGGYYYNPGGGKMGAMSGSSVGGGGGGGQGYNGGAGGGTNGSGGGPYAYYHGAYGGGAGTLTASGAGGGGSYGHGAYVSPNTYIAGGSGGSGGTLGVPGGSGSGATWAGETTGSGGVGGAGGVWTTTSASPGPTSGGTAGGAVSGNSNITWVATGTRLGVIA